MFFVSINSVIHGMLSVKDSIVEGQADLQETELQLKVHTQFDISVRYAFGFLVKNIFRYAVFVDLRILSVFSGKRECCERPILDKFRDCRKGPKMAILTIL